MHGNSEPQNRWLRFGQQSFCKANWLSPPRNSRPPRGMRAKLALFGQFSPVGPSSPDFALFRAFFVPSCLRVAFLFGSESPMTRRRCAQSAQAAQLFREAFGGFEKCCGNLL